MKLICGRTRPPIWPLLVLSHVKANNTFTSLLVSPWRGLLVHEYRRWSDVMPSGLGDEVVQGLLWAVPKRVFPLTWACDIWILMRPVLALRMLGMVTVLWWLWWWGHGLHLALTEQWSWPSTVKISHWYKWYTFKQMFWRCSLWSLHVPENKNRILLSGWYDLWRIWKHLWYHFKCYHL